MDINLMPDAFRRSVHQQLLNDRNFDVFVLEQLWLSLSQATKDVLTCSKVWYFGELEVADRWQVPALVILSSGATLLAQPRYWDQLVEIASHCKALTACDRVQLLGSDIGIRLWFDYSSQQWLQQNLPLPADWHTEGN
jgi:hypothetical protein